MSHHHFGPRHSHHTSARPGHGTRWKITQDLSVRFIHNSVDGAEHLRAVAIGTKATVLKLKNRPGSRLSPSTQVLNELLRLSVDDDLFTDRTVTLVETSAGDFAVSVRGKLPHPTQQVPQWTEIPDDGGADPAAYVISGLSTSEVAAVAARINARARELASPEITDQETTFNRLALALNSNH